MYDSSSYDYLVNNSVNNVNTGLLAGIGLTMLLFWLVVVVFYIVCMWKVFTKAKKPGWASIVPIYNIIVELQIIGRPTWWILLFLIPFVNFVVAIIIAIDLAKSFGKDAVFGVLGLVFFSFVGYPILAFGSAKYVGPAASVKPATATN